MKGVARSGISRVPIVILTLALVMLVVLSIHLGKREGANREEGGEIVLVGSGATFPQPQIEKWIDLYTKRNPGVKIEYTGKGSGGGQNDFKNGLVDFACSDPPLKEDLWRELEQKGQPLQFPVIIGAVSIVYNLPGVDNLRLSKGALVAIFLGKIEYWDDPMIKELNPKASLPHKKIIVVHRSDSSGTTAIFTTYLSIISEEWREKVGAGKVIDWPVDKLGRGLGGKGNQGVAAIIKQNPNSIGYVEFAYSINENLQTAFIENRDGNFVAPSPETIKSAISRVSANVPPPTEGYKEKLEQFLEAPGENSYPIIAFSHMIVWGEYSPDKAEVIKDFITWVLMEGQKDENIMTGYVGLPEEVAEIGLSAIEIIKPKP